MLRSVMTLIGLCLAVAVVGWQFAGGFVLTLVALAGVFVLGATAVSLRLRPAVRQDEPAVPAADVLSLAAARRPQATGPAGEEWGRAA